MCKKQCVIISYDIMTHHPPEVVQIYKGKYYNKPQNAQRCNKVIVFDLDETFGYFFELKILWNYITSIGPDFSTPDIFNVLLDMYPEFLRYGIISILDYIYNKKLSGKCHKVYVFTNNKYDHSWVNLILDYFVYKLDCKTKLFDQVIYAFKINNKQIEVKRTKQTKTYEDFINCTMLPYSTEICFVDNNYFPDMNNERVYYIQPLSYYHNMKKEEIMCRFINSDLWKQIKNVNLGIKSIKSDLFHDCRGFHMNSMKIAVDFHVAQKIMFHIKEFFYFPKTHQKTKKNNRNLISRTTRKNRPYVERYSYTDKINSSSADNFWKV